MRQNAAAAASRTTASGSRRQRLIAGTAASQSEAHERVDGHRAYAAAFGSATSASMSGAAGRCPSAPRCTRRPAFEPPSWGGEAVRQHGHDLLADRDRAELEDLAQRGVAAGEDERRVERTQLQRLDDHRGRLAGVGATTGGGLFAQRRRPAPARAAPAGRRRRRGQLGPVGDVLKRLLVGLELQRLADRAQALGEGRRVLALAHHPEQEGERLRRSDLPHRANHRAAHASRPASRGASAEHRALVADLTERVHGREA